MGNLFGTDGVRGVANTELTPELAYKIGRAGGYLLSKGYSDSRILLGKDTRISGDMLEGALIAGICSVGVSVLKAGVIPTSAVAYLTRHFGASAGVMISASHNPIDDNGIKIFSSEGFKLSEKLEDEIEELVFADDDELPRPTGEELGTVREVKDAVALYSGHIKKHLRNNFKGLKIVLDCAHGASCNVAPAFFKEMGAEVITLFGEADGSKINIHCGSTHPGELQKKVVDTGANLGLAFDGDADRVIAVDENGHIVDGDQMMTIFARHLKKNGNLKGNTVVATVMSNIGFEKALKAEGVELVRAKVGDKYVLEEMIKREASLGGEQSGHIIFLDYNTTGDGLVTAAQLVDIMKETGETLSSLASRMRKYPQILVNIKAKFKDALSQDEEISQAIAEMEDLLKDRGRLLVRPSGTEPLIRVMAEGPDEKELEEVVGRLAKIIEEKLA